jgi:four helix bundle protein
VNDFLQVKVWQKSKNLAVLIYRATESYPRSERFGLVNQTRRAAISISANIAEGCGRRSDRDMARFVDIALGSAYELASHIELAAELGFMSSTTRRELGHTTSEVRRMLVGLRRSLSN